MSRWEFKVKLNSREFTIGYFEYKLLEYVIKNNGINQSYRRISKELDINRGTLKDCGTRLLKKGLINSGRKITSDGLKVLELLRESIEKKKLNLISPMRLYKI